MIVQRAVRQYTGGRVSVRHSASAVEEASRSKTASPSGRLLLRMPPGLHAALARAAEREGASLNGYIIARLTSSVDWTPAKSDEGPERGDAPPPSRRTLTWLLAANVVAVTIAGTAAIAILVFAWLA
jgi:hypothetical protein